MYRSNRSGSAPSQLDCGSICNRPTAGGHRRKTLSAVSCTVERSVSMGSTCTSRGRPNCGAIQPTQSGANSARSCFRVMSNGLGMPGVYHPDASVNTVAITMRFGLQSTSWNLRPVPRQPVPKTIPSHGINECSDLSPAGAACCCSFSVCWPPHRPRTTPPHWCQPPALRSPSSAIPLPTGCSTARGSTPCCTPGFRTRSCACGTSAFQPMRSAASAASRTSTSGCARRTSAATTSG